MKRITLLAVLIATFSGCVHHYRPPQPNEPHAIVKLRRTYEVSTSLFHRESVLIDDDVALSQQRPVAEMARTFNDALLVHPRPTPLSFGARFFHFEQRTSYEPYTVYRTEHYTESYSCGSGMSYRTCTRSAYRSVPHTEYRWVTRTVEVVDDGCDASFAFAPRVGSTYLFDYTFRGGASCTLQCYEQVMSGGQLRQVPCQRVVIED